MLIKHRGFAPEIDPTAFIAPTAVLAGRVVAQKDCRIMYGAVLDSEGSSIKIGECAIICENAVLRATAAGDREYTISVGNNVFIGPHATLLGCTIHSYSFIATGATVLHGAVVHSGAAIAVGAFVHAGTIVPAGLLVPPNTIAMGDPVKIFSPSEKEALADAIRSLGFPRIAFGTGAARDRSDLMKQVTETRSKEFGGHFDDDLLQ